MLPQRPLKLLCGALLALPSLWVHGGQAPAMVDLPPTETVQALILARPEVRAASAGLRADQAAGERLRASPHETTVRLQTQTRHSAEPGSAAPSQRYTEAQVALERTLRLPAKARQDDQVAQTTEALADVRKADAIHEASRALLRAWFDWQRDRALLALWHQQLEAQQALLDMAERRVRAGDAARTELLAQQAVWSQLETERQAAQTQEALSQARLNLHYPGLSAQAPPLSRPQASDLPVRPASEVIEALTNVSHERQVAERMADLAQAEAAKLDLGRQIDPTVGLYAARERGGAERVLGVSLSLPWGGAGREAAAKQGWAQALQAQESARSVSLAVRAQSEQAWLEAQGSLLRWQGLEASSQRLDELLQKMVKGWQLGEYGHGDVLQARRQHLDALKAAVAARADARHAACRLWLDLHEIWDFDDATPETVPAP
ncbi:MAG: hypothetical protein RI907_1345 [Pseudomonadota bacterium]|jgi:outer membrane protein TolC